MNPFGITNKSFQLLMGTFAEIPQIEEVVLFGSRAKGTYKKGSDIDLAIKGEDCTVQLALTLQGILNEELPIPYMVDVVHYESLEHQDLIEHIDQ